MNLAKTMAAAAGLVALLGGTAACGGSSSSTAADKPTAVSKTTFCSTFSTLDSKTTPKEASTKLGAVGVPADIDAKSKDGFAVLVANLAKLPDDAQAQDFTAMQKGLSTTEQADVAAFGTYLQKECAPSAPASSSATSPSPSN